MPVIGTFTAAKDGYAGTIRTLMLNGRVRIIANDHKTDHRAPDFRVTLANMEIGAAWRRIKHGSKQSYLRIRLDDPSWSQPIWGVLLEASDERLARLIWNRTRASQDNSNRAETDESGA